MDITGWDLRRPPALMQAAQSHSINIFMIISFEMLNGHWTEWDWGLIASREQRAKSTKIGN